MKDDSLSDVQKLNMSEANCPHGIAMDIYCEKCEPVSVGITYNERLIQEMSKERISQFAEQSVIAREVWNAAIEAAMKCVSANPECLWMLKDLKK